MTHIQILQIPEHLFTQHTGPFLGAGTVLGTVEPARTQGSVHVPDEEALRQVVLRKVTLGRGST